MINVGTDILVLNGDIAWEGDNLATVSGADNVQQQAYLRGITDVGESVFFKTFGARLIQYAALPFTEDNKTKLETEARGMLLEVGNSQGKGGWIEQVLECRAEMVTIEGKQAKMLFAKYIIRGDTTPRTMHFKMDGV